jgi:hypothetical protein
LVGFAWLTGLRDVMHGALLALKHRLDAIRTLGCD